LAATIVPLLNELEFGSHQCWQQSKNNCHEMPINRGIMWEQNVRENVSVCKRVERKRAAMAATLLPLQQLQVQQRWVDELRRVDVILLLYICVVTLSLSISNNIDSPVDVGGFAEPRKILCQCALPFFEQVSVHHRSAHGGAGIPNNWYQSWWFKGVFDFCSKMKVFKILFWPYHCVEEEETKPPVKTASKSDVGHGRTLHHSPAKRLPRAPTRPTRPLHPVELTRPEYQLTRPMWLTRIRMTSAWRNSDVIMNSRHARDDISMM
jgi:hypothetical protein